MNAGRLLAVDTDTWLALCNHLNNSGSGLSPGDAASQAIRAWLAANAPLR